MVWDQIHAHSLSRPDRLVIEIERLIVSGRLAVGERVPPERELAQLLGVSRTSVRDALRDLSGRGLLDRRPGRGTIVCDPSIDDSADVLTRELHGDDVTLTRVMEVRACVEPPIAARAALTVTERDLAALRAILHDQEATKGKAEFATLDRTFHRSIALYTKNPLLTRLLDNINELVEPSRQVNLQTAARRRTSVREHWAIFDAIAARDPGAAQAAAAAHVLSVERRVVAATRKQLRPAAER